MSLLLVIVLILVLLGVLPQWGYHSYGYVPSGVVGILLVLLLLWVLFRGL